MSPDPRAVSALLELTGRVQLAAERVLAHDPASDTGSLDLRPPPDGPLATLSRAFQLSALEFHALVCLLAAEVEPIFRTLLKSEQREGGRPWLELGTIADLLSLDRPALPALFEMFLPTGRLRELGLALVDEPADGSTEVPLIHLRVKAARRVLRYAEGIDELPAGMSVCATPRPVLRDSLLPSMEAEDLLGRLRYGLLRREPLCVAMSGLEGVGKKFLAEGLCAELGRPLLFVDVRKWERRHLLAHLADTAREATLARALPYLDAWDVLIDDELAGIGTAGAPPSIDGDEPRPSTSRRPLPPALTRFLERRGEIVFLGGRDRYPQLERLSVSVVPIALHFPGPTRRARLWDRAVAAEEAVLLEGIDADELGRKFALDPARILAATRTAAAAARLRRPSGAVALGRDEIIAASRLQLQHELASLAVRVDKAHKWEDLVIPVEVYESLQELLTYVRHAGAVYESQGFAARHSISPGISALFAGPPGTGKTMCASIVARELEMELFRIDLSRVVSKWIGETEKNLAKVFDEAQRSQAVILFDEADSLFARRTEVKSSIDRYANLEVSYLLQRMEQFSGVTILTTNFEDTIDPAFKRRMTFKMRFEKPDAAARASLWSKMFPKEARLALDVNWKEIGQRFELSGGLIRNAVVRAAFIAADAGTPISHQHILTAAAREAREMGALVAEPTRRQIPAGDTADPDAPPEAAEGALPTTPRPPTSPRLRPLTPKRR